MPSEEDQLFCSSAVDRKLVSREQADECLMLVDKMSELGLSEHVSHVLIKKGYLTPSQSKAVYKVMGLKKGEEIIPGYEIVAKLGEGAMGAVYKANRLGTSQTVALKVLPQRLAKKSKEVKRFLREATALATLNHKNIVAGFEVGEARGLNYFVMEFVDGPTLQEVLDKTRRLPEKDALDIIIQIADALDHASTHGIVHRDIKPENIMLTKDGVAKLSDLGLSKNIDETRITAAGTIFGTPNYISPEQAKGFEEIDIRSDIYSLGATFFHMITGAVPFEGDTPLVVINRHVTEDVPSPKTLVPSVSDGLCDIIKRMTARDRKKRYQSPRELMQELVLLRDSQKPEPVRAAEPKKSYFLVASDQTKSLRRRKVDSSHIGSLKKKADAMNFGNLFLETQEEFTEEEIVEFSFIYQNNSKEADALGIIEWCGKEKEKSGVGIRILSMKIREIEKIEKPTKRKHDFTFEMLVQKGLNQKLLKLYFRELEGKIKLTELTRKCGASKMLIEKVLLEFEMLGLIEKLDGFNEIKFVRPKDQQLWKNIADWVKKYGLS